jgi:NitT/TauT family transport system permease protein
MSADLGLRLYELPDAVADEGMADGDHGQPALARKVWSATWPKLVALGIVLAVWQVIYATHWRPDYVLPSPGTTLHELGRELTTHRLWLALGITARRAAIGFGLAVLVGTALGLAVSRSRVLRAGVGSLVTGLQTMPSIAWFPLALLVFSYTERAITFVVVLGAAPSVANGIIAGVDHVPPPLLRVARTLGARGFGLYRHVVIPAALPTYVSGLKQGWAFAWRSLMAGELLVIIAHRPSLGVLLDFDRQNSDAASMISIMIVILVIGMVVDIAFNYADRGLRKRRGLINDS